jgi:hypothetical protein
MSTTPLRVCVWANTASHQSQRGVSGGVWRTAPRWGFWGIRFGTPMRVLPRSKTQNAHVTLQ